MSGIRYVSLPPELCGLATVALSGSLTRDGECSFPLAGLRRTALARSDHVTVSTAQLKTGKGGRGRRCAEVSGWPVAPLRVRAGLGLHGRGCRWPGAVRRPWPRPRAGASRSRRTASAGASRPCRSRASAPRSPAESPGTEDASGTCCTPPLPPAPAN